jgi:uncharacterized membrane protein
MKPNNLDFLLVFAAMLFCGGLFSVFGAKTAVRMNRAFFRTLGASGALAARVKTTRLFGYIWIAAAVILVAIWGVHRWG